jgi:hypothetical protein
MSSDRTTFTGTVDEKGDLTVMFSTPEGRRDFTIKLDRDQAEDICKVDADSALTGIADIMAQYVTTQQVDLLISEES